MPLRKHLLLSIFLLITIGLPSNHICGQALKLKLLYLSNANLVDQVRADSAWQMLVDLCSQQNLLIERYDLHADTESIPPLNDYAAVILTENPVYSISKRKIRQEIESYLLGDEDRNGGNLMLLFDKKESFPPANTDPRAWQWFMQLLSSDFLQKHKSANTKDIGVQLQASSVEREASIKTDQISYSRQLPHPIFNSGLEGGKVFVTYLGKQALNFSRDDEGHYRDPLFVNHVYQAIKWQLGGEMPNALNIDYLNLAAWPDKDQVRLAWQFRSEGTIVAFRLLCAEDESNWKTIYQINTSAGKGESREFEFVDRDKKPGRYYYQLKSKTARQPEQSSRILVVDIGGVHPELTLFPNPTNQDLFVNIGLLQNSEVELSIESRVGEILLVRDLGEVLDGHKEKLAIGHFLPGLYILRIKAGEIEAVKNFVKYD